MFFSCGSSSKNSLNCSLDIFEASTASAFGYSFLISARMSLTRLSGIKPGGGRDSVAPGFIATGGGGGRRAGAAIFFSSCAANKFFANCWACSSRNFSSAIDVLSGLRNTEDEVLIGTGRAAIDVKSRLNNGIVCGELIPGDPPGKEMILFYLLSAG